VLAETGAEPHRLLALGEVELSKLIADASRNRLGRARARVWLDAAGQALELCGDHPALAFEDRAAEIQIYVRLLLTLQQEMGQHERAREQLYQELDPQELTRSLPGLGPVSGPALAAIIGRATRFADGDHLRSFAGLAPKSSETGETERKGQRMTKAGSALLRTTLYLAADRARHSDPQLAAIYRREMTEKRVLATPGPCACSPVTSSTASSPCSGVAPPISSAISTGAR
jgi:transposase